MFDVHCHLEYMDNAEEVIRKAKEKDCRFCAAVSDLKDVRKVIGFADNKNVFVALGLHPERSLKYEDLQLEDYEKIIRANVHRIIAIGEIGLDYAWVKDEEKCKRTKVIFRRFLRLAKELSKPVVIHCRDAFPDTLQILKEELPNNEVNVIIHFFSGTKEDLKVCLERGYWISFNTIAVRSKSFRKLIEKTPIDRLLLETDAPWCDPYKERENENITNTSSNSKPVSSVSGYDEKNSNVKKAETEENKLTNVPWNIVATAELVARLKDMTPDEVLKKTEENARISLNIKY